MIDYIITCDKSDPRESRKNSPLPTKTKFCRLYLTFWIEANIIMESKITILYSFLCEQIQKIVKSIVFFCKWHQELD